MSKFRWLCAALLVIAAVPGGLAAQATGTVQGTVVDAANLRPLENVQVFVPGTSVGTLTNASGRFILVNVPAGNQTIRANLIGFGATEQTVSVTAGQAVELDLQLQSEAISVEGIVVTALGLERQARTLGVAAQSVDDEALSRVERNIVTSLSGQVSGVNITSASTQGGSSRIVIRGENSLLGNNQPLFIIDGVPVDNYSSGTMGVLADQGGFDYGNAISDINPDAIQSITVLKGPNAAALYGSRASNGAVIIQTKNGAGAVAGAQITASQTVSWENELRLPRYQNQYGQGLSGVFEYVDGAGGGIFDDVDESWGPPLDQDLMIPQFNSPIIGTGDDGRPIRQPLPWVSRPDNVDEFFELGNTLVTNVSIAAATDRLNGRFGFAQFGQDGMVPGFNLDRTTLSFSGGMEATERLNVNTSIQYVTSEGRNRPGVGYGEDNPMAQFVWFGRQVDVADLKRNYDTVRPEGDPQAGLPYSWNYSFHPNPYYLQLENNNWDTRNRLIGQISAGYQFNDWLTGTLSTSTDWYQDLRMKTYSVDNFGGLYTTNPLTGVREPVAATGAFGEWDLGFQETNTSFLLAANPELNLPFSTAFTLGGNRRDWEQTHNYTWVGEVATPGIFNVSNAAVTPAIFSRLYEKRVNSLYGQAEFGYNDYLFLTLTGRNDWSSTLPEENNSYFYPSVSGSFVFSDAVPALQETGWLSYGKLRASWARVGNDTDPYNLRNTYIANEIWDGNPGFEVGNALLNENLKPESTQSYEVGTELAFLDNRIGLDLTYYREETRDQIMPVSVSASTGYTSFWLNAGTVRNTGVELLLRGSPIRTQDFGWETSFTWSKNNSKVVDLAEGVEGLEISNGDFWGASLFAREGDPYGQLMGRAYQRSPDGRVLVNANGFPLRTPEPVVIGNINPDWRAGWSNDFNYRGFRLSTLLDARVGGDIYSVTRMFGRYAGVLEETVGRGRCAYQRDIDELADNGIISHYPACDATTGLIVDGVRRVVDGSDTTYVENDIPLNGVDYFTYNDFQVHEANIVDGSFVKLRELSLSYDVPANVTDRLRVGGLQLGLFGRNLWLWTPSENKHIDPETAAESSNVQGFEYGQMPSPRSFGFTVTVQP